MIKRLFYIIILVFCCNIQLTAKEKLVKCGGTFPYYYSENISLAEAKAKAVENAVIMALADQFGTTVTSQSLMEIADANERFAQMSRLQVKGTLVRHIHKPKISDPVYSDNTFAIEVTVEFYARELKYAPVEYSAKALRNGKEDKFESNTFVAGDKFYMSFKSPREGYLAVFFEDRETASCMLPYVGDDNEPFHVEKDKRYLLFDVTNNTYHLSCGEEPEINYVHIIFSPYKFIDRDLTREMTCAKFRDWLGTRQSYDEDIQVESIMIRVNPARD